MKSTKKGQKDQVRAYNTRSKSVRKVGRNYDKNLNKTLQCLKQKILKSKNATEEQFGEKGTAICAASSSKIPNVTAGHRVEDTTKSGVLFDRDINDKASEKTDRHEKCVNSLGNRSNDDADFSGSSNNLYVPETTDESDSEIELDGASSVSSKIDTTETKLNHHEQFGEKGTAICAASTSKIPNVTAGHRVEDTTKSGVLFDRDINDKASEKTDSHENCVNSLGNRSNDDADFSGSSNNLYVPETTDESDSEIELDGASSVSSKIDTTETKLNHHEQFGEKGTAICAASSSKIPNVTAGHRVEDTTKSGVLFDRDINDKASEKTDSHENCVNSLGNRSDDDADFSGSSDNLYVPETTDESDSEIELDGASSVSSKIDTTETKLNHHVTFDIHNEASEKSSGNKLIEEEEQNEKKRIRQKDFCFYCENLVLNFARHAIRNHPSEPEVQKALSMPKNSKSRKQAFTLLRKKGNYITNTQNSTFKPMKKSKYNKSDDYLPCTKCLGFYSRKQLWKHKKLCDNTNLTSSVQVDAQNFLLRNIKVSQKLKEDVFPRMRPDKISMFAKKDPLICAFGLQYLRTHREKHFINVTSRKMRELGKLLIEIKKIKPVINSLLDALKPQNYGTLVLATKNAASFNSSKDRYDSPTYAMNIATSLKQCCNIALLESYKAEADINRIEIQTDLKTLTSIIQSNWKFDVSSQAADDLNMKRYNKTTIVPLASDLKCLKDHLIKTAAHAVTSLTESNNSLNCNAFNELLESVFCRVLLLNRRRPGELQRLQLSYYENYDKKDNENNKYEEFDKVLSPTEKILVNSLKRIVIRGKRGRGVPVLFSKDVQKDIETLISIRHKYVNTDNDFLFSKAGGSMICGYKTIEKYAKTCGAKNPKALTSTRLRKHLATLTQLFNMSENDMEQLASFMGHTMSIHKQNYRLPDDVFQTAKISKLLLLMEAGKADLYKGRTLDEININLDEEITGDDIQNEEILDFEILESTPVNKTTSNPIKTTIQATPSCYNTSTEQKVIKNKRVLIPWTAQQKRVVLNFFSKHIKSRKPPKRNECENLRSQYPELLSNKDWLKIKVFIQNTYTKQ